MRPDNRTVVFLHGIGAGPESWDAQLESLPEGWRGFAAPIPGLRDRDADRFSLAGAAQSVRTELDRRGIEAAHLCGLSLGAMIATRFALDHPGRAASLTLSGGQVRPNRALMRVQTTVVRLLPARVVTPPGLSKRTLLAILADVARTDVGPELARICVPTLVLCGSRDRPNLPAARRLAAGIPGAVLEVVPGARHEWNTQLPEEFAARLHRFLTGLASRG